MTFAWAGQPPPRTPQTAAEQGGLLVSMSGRPHTQLRGNTVLHTPILRPERWPKCIKEGCCPRVPGRTPPRHQDPTPPTPWQNGMPFSGPYPEFFLGGRGRAAMLPPLPLPHRKPSFLPPHHTPLRLLQLPQKQGGGRQGAQWPAKRPLSAPPPFANLSSDLLLGWVVTCGEGFLCWLLQ